MSAHPYLSWQNHDKYLLYYTAVSLRILSTSTWVGAVPVDEVDRCHASSGLKSHGLRQVGFTESPKHHHDITIESHKIRMFPSQITIFPS